MEIPENAVAAVAMTTLDCAEAGPEARFWSELLGWEVVAEGEGYAMLSGPYGQRLGFGEVPGYQPPSWPDEGGRKQFHLDLAVDDLDAAQQRAVELGARPVDPQPGDTWRVLLDPAGHPFCLTSSANW